MKQVFQNLKSGETKVDEIVSPKLKRGGVLVRNHFSLISPGTERGIIELSKKGLLQKARERPDYVRKFAMLAKTKGIFAAWKVAQSKLTTDIALGYSTSGEVIKVASDVEEFRVGDRVACAGQNYASHSEIIFVPKNLCVKIPKGISDKEAAFVTLGSIALQGIHQAKLSPGEKVAVIGLGFLGQLAVRMLRAYGHPTIGFDISEKKVEFAKKHSGLDAGVVVGKKNYETAVTRFTEGIGVDAALIYASSKSESPLELATAVCRDKGRIVQIGNIRSNIPWRDFYKKELSYHASRSYGPGRYDPTYEEGGNDYPVGHVRWTEKRNMEEFLRLVDEKKVIVNDLITEVFDIKEAHKAYELVFKGGKLLFGILLSYQQKKQEKDTLVLKPRQEQQPGVQEVRIGFIGVGSFALSTIFPHLKKIQDKDVKLIAVCSATGKKATDVARKWGAEYVTNDYRKLIKDKNINLIICATRHSSHAQIAKEVLKADKNLYMEKPLALNQNELKEVMKVAGMSKGRLFIGFNRRFAHHFIRAREEFQNSPTPLMILYRISYPFAEKDHWSYDLKEGGRIIGEECHFIDSLNFITGSSPRRVYASVIPVGGGVEREENTSITVEYDNGSLGTIFYSALGSYRLPKEYIEIYGDGKAMLIDNFKNGKIVYDNKVKKENLPHQDKGYDGELEAIFDAIREGKPSSMSLKEIWESHIATFEAYNSFKDGEAKKLGNEIQFKK
ncbi:MAG TPA: oxidoreductase [Candidatus Jorgensenbacteria bacterium]|nr:oxidoreductase [Candidatus Jorgensenbacteria bacterium]